jgi:hypothetical protein
MENTLFIAAKFHTTRNKKRGFKQIPLQKQTSQNSTRARMKFQKPPGIGSETCYCLKL